LTFGHVVSEHERSACLARLGVRFVLGVPGSLVGVDR
jgi:hypothetical protein